MKGLTTGLVSHKKTAERECAGRVMEGELCYLVANLRLR